MDFGFLFHFSTFIDLNEPFHSVKNLESFIAKKFWRGNPCTVLLVRPQQKKIGERIDGKNKTLVRKKNLLMQLLVNVLGLLFLSGVFFYLLKLIKIQSFTLDYCDKLAKILVFQVKSSEMSKTEFPNLKTEFRIEFESNSNLYLFENRIRIFFLKNRIRTRIRIFSFDIPCPGRFLFLQQPYFFVRKLTKKKMRGNNSEFW